MLQLFRPKLIVASTYDVDSNYKQALGFLRDNGRSTPDIKPALEHVPAVFGPASSASLELCRFLERTGDSVSLLIDSKLPLQEVSLETRKERKARRRGTRGRMRAIKRETDFLTNLHIEAVRLTEAGLRNDRELVEVKRRLIQIASTSGLEIYPSEDITHCVRILSKDLNSAMVEKAVRTALDYVLDPETQKEIESEFKDRHETMHRMRAMAVDGQVLGSFDLKMLKFGTWFRRALGFGVSRPVE